MRIDIKRIVFLALVGSLLLSASCANLTRAASTTVQVDPPVSNVTAGNTFNVNITVTDVTNLTGWEFKLFYLNALLNCTTVTEGPFLTQNGGSTFHIFNITNNYNSTYGRVLAGCALEGMNLSQAVSGSGLLATLTFKALFGGDSPLDLVDTKLSDEKMPPQPIPNTPVDGIVHVAGAPPVHDIAVVGVTTSKDGCKPMMTVPDNMFVKINVTVLNNGGSAETFSVILYANATTVDTKAVSNLLAGVQAVVEFRWNTTGWAHGNYTMSGHAVPVAGETNTGDNTFTDGVIKVVIPGDVKGDGIVDIFDAILLAGAYNTVPNDPRWNPNADLKTDDIIDIFDAIVLAGHFNQHE